MIKVSTLFIFYHFFQNLILKVICPLVMNMEKEVKHLLFLHAQSAGAVEYTGCTSVGG